jgi:ubiquinone/menaquinone biosynthesis C-methylase UbiE
VIDYDTELQLHNERLRQAYEFTATDRILDIGCGTGQTTRDAARLAPDGMAVGVDIDEAMVARARELAATEGIPNVRFERADVERHPFRTGEFDVAISRFGTMFFADSEAAFRNIARAIRSPDDDGLAEPRPERMGGSHRRCPGQRDIRAGRRPRHRPVLPR